MQILMVSSAKGWAGGEVYVARLADGMTSRGHTVAIACREGFPLHQHMTSRGYACLPIAPRNSADLRAILRLAAALKGFDVAHAHVGRDYAPVALAAGLARRPCIATRHLLLPMKPLSVYFLKRFSRVVAISGAMREVLVNDSKLPVELVATVTSGVDTEKFRPHPGPRRLLPALGLPAVGPVFGLVNQLHPGKRIDLFIEAAALLKQSHPEVRHVIVGEGPHREAIEQGIRSHGLEQEIRLTGARDDVPDLMPELTALVLATEGEPFGLVVLEAMACGIPVIAANAGGPAELVLPGETGWLVTPGSARALADAMQALLSDPARGAAMGSAGRTRVERRFSQARMMDQMDRLYHAVVGTPRKQQA